MDLYKYHCFFGGITDMQSTLNMGDIIEKTGLPKDDIVFVRHSLNDKNLKNVWRKGNVGFLEEYQKIQRKGYFHNKKYVFSFISDKKTTARFIGVYKVVGCKPIKKSYVSKEYWNKFSDIHNLKEDYFFELVKLDILEDLQNRLVIEYVSGTNPINVNWNTISMKAVISISSMAFPGYENVIWNYSQLETYVKNPEWYEDIVSALSRVNGVYLIVDKKDSKQYIGSAYNEEGIWGRWRDYVKSEGTGDNVELKKIIEKDPSRKYYFQFSILSVIPHSGNMEADSKRARDMEILFKKKLLPQLNLN